MGEVVHAAGTGTDARAALPKRIEPAGIVLGRCRAGRAVPGVAGGEIASYPKRGTEAHGTYRGSPGTGGNTGVSFPQPCVCTVFMSFIRSSGSFSFSFGRPF